MVSEKRGSERPLLLSVHGIRTTGKWQKDLSEVADEAGIRYRPLDFGYFLAFSLLLPWKRQSKIEWFRAECEHKTRDLRPGSRASIIAHSFGTYLLANALVKYSDLRFDKVILCGSIVRTDFPWNSIIHERDQVRVALNEAGGRDLWSSLATWIISDAGPSGVFGFNDQAEGRVVQRLHVYHRHSDYFYATNFRSTWIPFLRGLPLHDIKVFAPPRVNWRFVTTIGFFMFFILTGLSFYFSSNPFSKDGASQETRQRPSHVASVSEGDNSEPLSAEQIRAEQSTVERTKTSGDVAATASQNIQQQVALASSSSSALSRKKDTQNVMGAVSAMHEFAEPSGSRITKVSDDHKDKFIAFATSNGPLIINFGSDDCNLRHDDDTLEYLDRAVDMLQMYPGLQLTVYGYADGSESEPDLLSKCRAKVVKDYLVSHGIDKSRLWAIANGNSKPIDSNEAETGKGRNRRVEIFPLKTK